MPTTSPAICPIEQDKAGLIIKNGSVLVEQPWGQLEILSLGRGKAPKASERNGIIMAKALPERAAALEGARGDERVTQRVARLPLENPPGTVITFSMV